MNFSTIDFTSILIFFIVLILTLVYSKFKLLRIFVIVLMFLILFQPTFVFLGKKEKSNLAILIDNSKSMVFNQRLEKAKKFYRENLPLIEKYFETEFYQFSDKYTLIKKSELDQVKAKGNSTDILNTLNEIGTNDKYDAILIFSDGIDNVGPDIRKLKINKPVIAVCPKEEAIKDISIVEIKTGDFAFKNVPTEITIVFYSSGFEGKEANIYIRKGKEIVLSKKKLLDGSYQEVSFEITSSKLGTETYTAEIEPFPDEIITVNNRKNFTIETIREKIRILYICGQPSPEYYFLRYFLKSNPSIELVSFVILRNPEDIAIVPDEKLSLIPFPAREIFLKDLFDYDILILENFNYARFYLTSDYLLNVERFVREKGGGFLMIAGDNAFGKGAYSGTAIEKILPVIMDNPDEPFEEGLFNPVVVNRNHPLSFSEKDIYPLDGCQHLRQKPNTNVIAVHPTLKLEQKNSVVLACMEYGKGRTVALGTNTTWRWLLSSAYEGKSDLIYKNFWENIIYWLSSAERTKSLRISILQKTYTIGDEIKIKIILLDDKLKTYKPILTVVDPFSKIHRMENLIKTTDGWLATYIPEIEGEYTFRASVSNLEDKKTISVENKLSNEEFNLKIKDDFLKEIANSTGGLFFFSDKFSIDEIIKIVKKKEVPIVSKQIHVYLSPVIYFVILFMLILEWTLRRIKGLI